MEDLMKMIIKQRGQEGFSAEDIAKEIYDIIHENDSEIDKWYKVGDAFWIRRTTAMDYMSAQVYPLVDDAFLCYLHILCIGDYEKKQVDGYNQNVKPLSKNIPYDIRYIYPIAVSQDIESAKEKFIASNAALKNDWLSKLGIRGDKG